MALTSQFDTTAAVPSTYGTAGTQQTGAALVGSNLESFLNPNSTLMQAAARQGQRTAATRGGLNSSIAAGASQAASLDTAQTLASQATQVDLQRENTQAQDWLNQQSFSRELQGSMASAQFQNSLDMLSAVQAASISDPELYTPEVVSGYSNFFSQNMANILRNYT